MNGPALLGILLVMVIACFATAAGETTDSRFAHVHDKDHPHDFKADFADRTAWENRADFLRHQALVALGLWPMPPKTPLNPLIHGKIDRDEYTVEKVFFASMPGHYVSGNLYRPKNRTGKLPAVLAPYGHWPNGRFIWRDDNGVNKDLASGAETDPIAARTPLQANCAMLARMGCIVFHYDMVGYCDSTKIPHREGFLDTEAVLRCQSFMGLQTWNSIRSLDFVLSLPEVDAERIAVTGSSSGGTQTMALDAVDPRATVAFPMVMVSMNMQGGCVCENAPLYRVYTNNVEIASLFAPKPEGMAAANDWTVDFMTRGLPEMKRIWGFFGAADQVNGQHFDFGHNHNLHSREAQYAFLNRQLRLGWPEPVKEKPFVPVEPKDLSVYDDQHPRPADEVDAATLRKWMTHTSDEQIAALDPEQYRNAVGAALKAMIVDQMPDSGSVEASDGFLSRRGAGERVPYKLIQPANARGEVVIWAHPEGAKSLDSDRARPLVDAGYALLAIDMFDSGEFKSHVPPTRPARRADPNPAYAGYWLGYERSVIASRVHDLLTAIAFAHSMPDVKRVHLAGFGQAGAAALLARATAGDSVDRAAIDLNGFDFDLIRDEHDPMLLPGSLKYGGIYGFVPLCTNGSTLLVNARETGAIELARKTPHVVVEAQPRAANYMTDWLTQPEGNQP
jgi:dienelactone hydrolase